MAKKKNKKEDLIERLVEYKIRIENIVYAAEQIKVQIKFNQKDINDAIESIQNDSDRMNEFISSAESNLRHLCTVDLPERINKINFFKSKILRKVGK